MKRYFLILTFALLFFASGAVEAQVVVADSVATFFLERNEQVKVLAADNKNLEDQIVNLTKQRDDALALGESRAADVASYNGKIEELKTQANVNKSEIKRLHKEVNRQKLGKVISWVVSGFIIVIVLVNHG